jgi:hypothetical protein
MLPNGSKPVATTGIEGSFPKGKHMIELASRTSEAKILEQQKEDFTAEGAPPPGKSRAAMPRRASKVTRVRSNGPVTMPIPGRHPDRADTRPARPA